MDVLVLGGTGLISTGITRQLAAADHDVTVFNRGERAARIPDGVERVRGDRYDYDRFERQMADLDPECVVDMICFTEADAESAVRAFGGRATQYVLCSTVDVYDRPADRNPIPETAQRHDADHHVSEYGADKTAAEDAVLAAHHRGEFAATVVRPWSTYGETGGINHTFGQGTYYLDRIRRGLPIVVHGDGSGLWGPAHRDDVARAFVNALGNRRAYGEAYNVTSEETMAWDVYHRKVARALDAPDPDLVHVPTELLREAAPERTGMLADHFQFSTVFDNAKAKRDLDYRYTVEFEAGVRRTFEWLDERDRIDDAESEALDDRIVEAWRSAGEEFLSAL
jgi:nucleoside-diphosphate-sugar epimerase